MVARTRLKPSIDLLLPAPRRAAPTSDQMSLAGSIGLIVDGAPGVVERSRRRLQTVLEQAGLTSHVVARGGSANGPTIFLSQRASERPRADAYRLEITGEAVQISAASGSGLFCGVSTLSQWIRQHQQAAGRPPAALGGLTVDDRPAFRHRGVMLDVSRNKVPTMKTLMALIDRLAGWKINQLQLYTEHTFAYAAHRAVWSGSSPLTADEIRTLDSYCNDRFIELVPNQQSFGHMHRWLVHQPYRELAECPQGIEHPFSNRREPFSLCATDPRGLELLADLYQELLPNFSSAMFNVGLDETFDLGIGRSAAACEERGRHEVYLDYLRQVHRLAAQHGRRIQFWADIVLDHPELIARLPPNAVALNWGHEADHPFAGEAAALAASGLEFYVCPGTSSWNSFAGRADNALGNLQSAALAGRASGASGLLVTDWGDNGHLQPLSASYLGLLAGSALAWNPDTQVRSAQPIWQRLLDIHAFDAPESGLGRIAMALGNAYLATGTPCKNGTPLFHLLMSPHDTLDHGRYQGLSIHRLEVVLTAVGHALSDLDAMAADHAARVDVDELRWAARAIAQAGRIGIERFAAGGSRPLDQLPRPARREIRSDLDGLLDDLSPLWLERNRPGGLADSLARFADLRHLLSL